MLEWHKIQDVLLDMDGTLLDLHFDSHFWLEHLPRRYAQLHQLEAAKARSSVIQRLMAKKGQLAWYDLSYWSREFNVDILALKREVQHLIGFRSDALDFLRWLQEAHPRVTLATNADQQSLALKLELVDLQPYVDHVVSSAEIGIAKEAPEFWQALQTQIGFDPQHTLLIDDNEEVLASAQTFGIRYLLTIAQPDMRSPERELSEYPAVQTFASLLPQTTQGHQDEH